MPPKTKKELQIDNKMLRSTINALIESNLVHCEVVRSIMQVTSEDGSRQIHEIINKFESSIENEYNKTEVASIIKELITRTAKSLVEQKVKDAGVVLTHSCEVNMPLTDELKEKIKNRTMDQLKKIDPYKLEQLIGRLLTQMGYSSVVVTQKSNDGGIDLVAELITPFGRSTTSVQVKRRQNPINRPEIDQFTGALERTKVTQGLFITTSRFSNGAIKAVQNQQARQIELIDGEKLTELLITYGIVIQKTTVEFIQFNDSAFQP